MEWNCNDINIYNDNRPRNETKEMKMEITTSS